MNNTKMEHKVGTNSGDSMIKGKKPNAKDMQKKKPTAGTSKQLSSTTHHQKSDHQNRRIGLKKKLTPYQEVSATVKQKLERYINEECRETRFDPDGRFRTTPRMHEYDFKYKLIEIIHLNKKYRGKKYKRSAAEDKDSSVIDPKLTKCSRSVTLDFNVARLSQNATELFNSIPIETLSAIHGYRPHPKDSVKLPQEGRVHNYSRHIGAALHSKNYVDFYCKEGLFTGNKKKSLRLQKLKEKSSNDQDDKENNKNPSKNQNGKCSTSSQNQGAKQKSPSNTNVYKDNKKMRPKSGFPLLSLVSNPDDDYSNDFNESNEADDYSDDFNEADDYSDDWSDDESSLRERDSALSRRSSSEKAESVLLPNTRSVEQRRPKSAKPSNRAQSARIHSAHDSNMTRNNIAEVPASPNNSTTSADNSSNNVLNQSNKSEFRDVEESGTAKGVRAYASVEYVLAQ